MDETKKDKTQLEMVIERLGTAAEQSYGNSVFINNNVAKLHEFRTPNKKEDSEKPTSKSIIEMLHEIAGRIEMANQIQQETINGIEQIIP